MARLSIVFVLLATLSASLVAAFNQTLELENSNCDNNCFFSSFPGGSCTDDAACMCDKQQYREAYFCCMKDCNPNVLPDSITRQQRQCNIRNMPFTFDAEAVCGVKLTTSAGILVAATAATSTATTATVVHSTTGDSKSSTVSASTTTVISSTSTQPVSSAQSQTSSAGSTPAPTNAASGKGVILNTLMIIVALSAVLLC